MENTNLFNDFNDGDAIKLIIFVHIIRKHQNAVKLFQNQQSKSIVQEVKTLLILKMWK